MPDLALVPLEAVDPRVVAFVPLEPEAFGPVAFEELDFDELAFEAVDFAVDLEAVAFPVAGFDALERDVVDFDELVRLRFGLSLPIGSALPTTFTASPATSPTVPASFPAVRPTVLTTFPGSGIRALL